MAAPLEVSLVVEGSRLLLQQLQNINTHTQSERER